MVGLVDLSRAGLVTCFRPVRRSNESVRNLRTQLSLAFTTKLARMKLLLVLCVVLCLPVGNARLQEPQESRELQTSTCTATNCGDCVKANCTWGVKNWGGAPGCYTSCKSGIADLATAYCYSKSKYPTKTATEICKKQQIDKSDYDLCKVNGSSCGSCTSTKIAANNFTTGCFWLELYRSCNSEICNGFQGCGRAQCEVCLTKTTCSDCLDTKCAWVNGKCAKKCGTNTYIASNRCYTKKNYPFKTTAQICARAGS
jgi:hypothetical protein